MFNCDPNLIDDLEELFLFDNGYWDYEGCY